METKLILTTAPRSYCGTSTLSDYNCPKSVADSGIKIEKNFVICKKTIVLLSNRQNVSKSVEIYTGHDKDPHKSGYHPHSLPNIGPHNRADAS